MRTHKQTNKQTKSKVAQLGSSESCDSNFLAAFRRVTVRGSWRVCSTCWAVFQTAFCVVSQYTHLVSLGRGCGRCRPLSDLGRLARQRPTRCTYCLCGVNRFGLVVRRSAGKRKTTTQGWFPASAHLCLQRVWFMDTVSSRDFALHN